MRRNLLQHRIEDVTATVPALRRPLDPKQLRLICNGRTICGIRRRGKFIVVHLSDGGTLLLHLGMTGAIRLCPAGTPSGPHDRVLWRLADGTSLRFVDPRRFGVVEAGAPIPGQRDPAALPELGPEPLSAAFSAAYLYRLSRGRKRPIKNLLMDQAMVAGIGNIYASEALFRAGIRPRRQSRRLTRAEAARLVDAVRDVLREAIACGGTTIRDFQGLDGREGSFAVRLAVYGRTGEPCPRCAAGSAIVRSVLAGRSTYFCRACQH